MLHFVTDLVVSGFTILGDVTVHLVNTDDELLDTEKVDEDGVLASLALNFSGLGVTLGNGGGEVTVGWNHKKAHVGLGGTGDHVLDEITVTWGINDGVVLGFGEEFLGCASNGDTTLTFFLLAIHIEGEGERGLTHLVGFFLELDNITLGDTSKLEDEATGSGRFASIDVSADDDGKVSFAFSHFD